MKVIYIKNSPTDNASSVLGIREVLSLGDTVPFKKIGSSSKDPLEAYLPQCEHHPTNSDEYWICRIRHYTFTLYHPTSTCRMGAENDPTAVVDPYLRYSSEDFRGKGNENKLIDSNSDPPPKKV